MSSPLRSKAFFIGESGVLPSFAPKFIGAAGKELMSFCLEELRRLLREVISRFGRDVDSTFGFVVF